MNESEKNINSNQLPPANGGGWYYLSGLIVVFVCVWLEMNYKLFSYKAQKSALWKLYGVSNDTFSKWVKYFAADLVNHEDYVRKRQLTFLEVVSLVSILGIPEKIALVAEIKPQRVLRKQDLVERGEGSYRSLRFSVNEYHEAFEITPEAFARLSKFPPNISSHILEQYG